jgi:magnesium transporter
MVVNCAAYSTGCKVADIPLHEVGAWASREGHFVWVGLFEPSEEEMHMVQAQLGLHELAVEDAHSAHQRPKLEEYGDGLFVVLRTVGWNAGKRAMERGETHVFVGPRSVVSIRHGDTGSYAPVRSRCEATPGHLAKGPGFVLYALMDFVVDNYFPVIEHIEDRVAKLEQVIFGDHPKRNTTQRIYELKRRLIQVKRAVSPLVDVCNRLTRWDGHQLIPDEVRPYFRDVYDHVVRINDQVDGLRELLSGALEANLSLISIRQNDIMKQLASWAGILAVPTLLVGIWGMNFDAMPELHFPFGYPLALAFMGTLMWLLHRSSSAPAGCDRDHPKVLDPALVGVSSERTCKGFAALHGAPSPWIGHSHAISTRFCWPFWHRSCFILRPSERLRPARGGPGSRPGTRTRTQGGDQNDPTPHRCCRCRPNAREPLGLDARSRRVHHGGTALRQEREDQPEERHPDLPAEGAVGLHDRVQVVLRSLAADAELRLDVPDQPGCLSERQPYESHGPTDQRQPQRAEGLLQQ